MTRPWPHEVWYFPTVSGGAFPVLHFLGDALGHGADALLCCQSSSGRSARAPASRQSAGGTAALVTNLTWPSQRLRIGPSGVSSYPIRLLSADTWLQASAHPRTFFATAQVVDMGGRLTVLSLEPFEVAHLWSQP